MHVSTVLPGELEEYSRIESARLRPTSATWIASHPSSRSSAAALGAGVPDPTKRGSRDLIQVGYIIVFSRGRRVAERLLKVFLFQKRILPENVFSLPISGQDLKHSSHGDSHTANAGFAPTLAEFDGYPVKRCIQNHIQINYTGFRFHMLSCGTGSRLGTNAHILDQGDLPMRGFVLGFAVVSISLLASIRAGSGRLV